MYQLRIFAMCSQDLSRRVEEACLNGWPGLSQVVFDGWLLRFSRGHTRRANSISLLSPSSGDIAGKVGQCEALYARHGLPAIFRLSTLSADDIDAILDTRGYGPREDETIVLHRDLSQAPEQPAPDSVVMQARAGQAWFDALARIQNLDANARLAVEAILDVVAGATGFAASLSDDGRIAAVAFGAVHDGIVCLNAVATDAAFKRRGHARNATHAILRWAHTKAQARAACLPVVAANGAAISLYRDIGFRTEVSRYAYRRRP